MDTADQQESAALKLLEKKMQSIINPSPLQPVKHPLLDALQLTLSVKRDDLLHPEISGNKWRKLKYNLLEARRQQVDHIVSFGGAYSNHLHALAAAGFHFNFKTKAIIRGESSYAGNPTLKQCSAWGMELQFVTRQEYKKRADPAYQQSLQTLYSNALILPEGGSNQLALPGVMEAVREMLQQTDHSVDHIVTATGSGGTLAGIIAGVRQYQPKTRVTGIAVLKNGHYLNQEIASLLNETRSRQRQEWCLQTELHHGGYAKVPAKLLDFCEQFTVQTAIPVEPIYTGKMFFGLFQLIKQGYFKQGEHIVALHTGGLQGLKGLQEKHKRG
ncbi:1-aminocyclopropane-1-carboxylate deaminase/D-cysteine desulfhydrase [Psychromonas sp.]|uniref:1-aminocyclopropane-1-carboxylate deaminase/D-cysteine desulfhydrase n=1 Tax=Psychromonas sp. TaxID=1884585 RepID=UPI003563A990